MAADELFHVFQCPVQGVYACAPDTSRTHTAQSRNTSAYFLYVVAIMDVQVIRNPCALNSSRADLSRAHGQIVEVGDGSADWRFDNVLESPFSMMSPSHHRMFSESNESMLYELLK